MANVVLPRVRMFIPCADVDLEAGEPVIVHSPLHTIRMGPGIREKYLLEEIWFYIVLTDGVGTFRLSVELLGMDDVVLKRSGPEDVTFVGGAQLNVTDLRISMLRVPFPRPGLYEFRLMANHVHLEENGSALLRVLPG